MIYQSIQARIPGPLRRYIIHFESAIEDAVTNFAAHLPDRARVLDAGAGEGSYRHLFHRQRYTGIDLGIGDQTWNYGSLDAIADLNHLPFGDAAFEAAINIVTLEHVSEPARVLAEISRVLCPGGNLLLVVPHEWEEHQQPHDYFRYTRYGLGHLLAQAGLAARSIEPVGGFFRLLSRRMLNALQFFPGPWFFLAAVVFVPPALILPVFDRLDTRRNFTLGYICLAQKD